MKASLIVVSLVVALIVGLAANRMFSKSSSVTVGGEGVDITELISPIATLAVILSAFVLVQSLGSYGRAREQSGMEANSVTALGQAARRVKDPATAAKLQETWICYTRAVASVEWRAMGADGSSAPEVTHWVEQGDATFAAMRGTGGDPELDRMLSADTTRAKLRVARLIEAKPTIPPGLYWVMFTSIVASVVVLAALVRPIGNPVIFIGVVVVLAALLGGTLIMADDLDAPFSGWNKVEPTSFTQSQTLLEQDLQRNTPGASLPCDAEGRPT